MTDTLAKVVGYQYADRPVEWNQRDLIAYALGVGAKQNDLQFVYDKSWKPLPTYPVVLTFKRDGPDVNLFKDRVAGPDSQIPGLPTFDPDRGIHAAQSIEVLKPLPKVSGKGWKLQTRITGITENKSGVIVVSEQNLVDPSGTPYARLFSSSFNLGAKVTGQKFSKVTAGPPTAKAIPDRAPDYVFKDKTTPEQAILFRLSGDYNPLHIDPSVGQRTGFGGVILHGLSTFGFGARALLGALADNDASALKLYSVRFTAPVKPGDALETQIWEVGPGPDGTTEVAFVTKNVATGKVALGGGLAYIKKAEKSKL